MRCRGDLELVVRIIILFLVSASTTGTAAVMLRDDGCADALDFLVLLLNFLRIRLRVRRHPFFAILQCLFDAVLLIVIQLLAQALVVTRALCGRTHGVHVVLEGVLGIHALLHLLVLICELLSLRYHTIDLLLGQTALVVRDRDGLLLSGSLVVGSNI